MIKKLLTLACVMLLLTTSGAWAEPQLWCGHYSLATLNAGKADYSEARFRYADFSLGNTGLTVTADNKNLSGTVTLLGGRYSFWNGQEFQKVSNTQQTFRLGIPSWVNIGDEAEFYPFSSTGTGINFGDEANDGLNSVTATWDFPEMPSLNGFYRIPNFLTTEQQLENHVVYFEFKYSDTDATQVTGINWRVVKASDPSTALTLSYPVNFYRLRIWNNDKTRIVNLIPNVNIQPGDQASGTIDFDSPITASEIWRVMTKLYTSDEPVDKCYQWDYYTSFAGPDLHIFAHTGASASLVDGKSDYSTAKFSDIFFDIEDLKIVAEAMYFNDSGRFTIPGGGYEVKDLDTDEILATVATGTDMTFKLKNDNDADLGVTYLCYELTDDSGHRVKFGGEAETALNGKTVTWTFTAEDGNIVENKSEKLPNFKTTTQQLASGVPYVEIVSEDGYITALKYRIVTSSDTSTEITPSYRTDFTFRIYHDDSKSSTVNSYLETVNDTHSGTLTLATPQPLSTMKRLRVRLITYEDNDNPLVYQWSFYPAAAPQPINITTASLPDGKIGTSYSLTLAANTSDVTWSVSSGTLPDKLTLDPSTGVISGTPTTEGSSPFTVTATKAGWISATKDFTITVKRAVQPQTVTITTTTLPDGVVGTSYSTALSSNPSGAVWTLNGRLPSGLTLASSGRISGTPTTYGSFPFSVKATYGTGTADKSLTLTIKPLEITTSSLPDGRVNTAYSQKITSNGTGLAWSVSGGALPVGLTLDRSSGVLSGTPTRSGDYNFTIQASNAYGNASKSFSLKVTGSGGSRSGSGGGCSSLPIVLGVAVLAFFIRKH